MCLALNMAKMAKGRFSCAAIQETQYRIKKPHAEVRKENKRGVEFLGHKRVKAAIERPPAMVHQNHTDRFLLCQNGTAKNPRACLRHKGTGESPPNECRQPAPDTTPSRPGMPLLPGMPSMPPGNNARA